MPATAATPAIRRRELALVAGGLGLLAALVYGDHVASGGFAWDDWENWDKASHPGQPGFLGPFDLRQAAYRPVLQLLLPLPHLVFGAHPAPQLALALLLAVAASAAFFGLLRALGVARGYALAAAVLALVFPWSSSTRLWATGSVDLVAIVLACAATAIALRAMPHDPRRRVALTAAMWAAAVLTYEAVAAAALLVPALYAARAPWRTAVARWRVEALAAGAAALLVALATTKPQRPPAEALRHGGEIASQGLALAGRALAPWPAVPPVAALAAAAALITLALVVRRGAARIPAICAALSVAALALAWAPFVPGEEKYVPSAPGIYDRVNIVAGFALAALVVSLAATLVALAGRRAGPAAATVLLLAIATGWVIDVRGDVAAYARGAAAQRTELDAVARALPHPARAAVLAVLHDRTWAAPGVPIFGQPWDLGPALRARYGDPSLDGFPLTPNARLRCAPTALEADAHGTDDPPPAPYGRIVLVDAASGRTAAPHDAAGCRAAIRRVRGSA